MMRIDFKDAEDDGQGHWVVKRTFTHDDGTVEEGVHVFPKETLEWRAAEYNIDPADTNTLMDIVLAEPYLTDDEWAQGDSINDTEDEEKAKKDHIARCAKAKLRHRISTRASGKKAHVCDRIKRESPMNPEALELKREIIRKHRQAKRDKKQRKNARMSLMSVDPDANRIEKLKRIRDQIDGRKGTSEMVQKAEEKAAHRRQGAEFWRQQRRRTR